MSGHDRPGSGQPHFARRVPKNRTGTPDSTSQLPPTQDAQTPAKPAIPVKVVPYEKLEALTERQVWLYYSRIRAVIADPQTDAKLRASYERVRIRVRQHLVLRYQESAMRIARGYARRKMPAYSLADTCDLEQSVCIGLLEAVDSFDPNFGTTFMQFANMPGRSRIFGSVIDCLRKLQDYPRSIAALRRRVRPLMAHLRQVVKHEPTVEEFCSYYGEQYRSLVENPLVNTSVYNQSHTYNGTDEGDEPESDMSQGVEDHRDTTRMSGNLATPEAVENSNRILDVIEDKDIRFVIWAYYYMGFINDTIAEFLDCSTSSVAKKHRKGLEIIQQHFTLEEFRELALRR